MEDVFSPTVAAAVEGLPPVAALPSGSCCAPLGLLMVLSGIAGCRALLLGVQVLRRKSTDDDGAMCIVFLLEGITVRTSTYRDTFR